MDLSRPNVYLLRIEGPLLEGWKSVLKDAGVSLMESYGADTYSAFLTNAQRLAVMKLDFVESVRLYSGEMTAPAAQPGVAPTAEAESGLETLAMVTYDIRLHPGADVKTVQNWLAQHNVPVAAASHRKVRAYFLEGSPELAALANCLRCNLSRNMCSGALERSCARAAQRGARHRARRRLRRATPDRGHRGHWHRRHASRLRRAPREQNCARSPRGDGRPAWTGHPRRRLGRGRRIGRSATCD